MPLDAHLIKSITFNVAAGKWDDGKINWKYCDSTEDAAEAMRMFQSCRGYPFVEFTLHTVYANGTTTRVHVLDGGPLEKLIDGKWVYKSIREA